jgi:hypothetical protein
MTCFHPADWLKGLCFCSRDVETQLQIVMSTMANDGKVLLISYAFD